MSNTGIFEDQPKRNSLGFDITCQLSALLDMVGNEQQRHEVASAFGDLLDAVLPRLHALNDAAMLLFSDPNALTSGEVVSTVHGRKGEPA